ncbi:intramembrane protease 2 [Glonium stellatum]|uniref:Intramembrane protease 2 n=1 Tax=Glonium stellatum TaxID=574774 RepID=A0A8E2FBJ2_9PEZI|nr:intramembrane protease 2 [Glonium stellatum]
MSEPGPIAQVVGRIAYEFALVQPLIPTYLHLLISALFPIYAGAHASLSRPSSAAKPEKKSNRERSVQDDTDTEEEEEEEYQRMEGLSPTDALMFPLMAGTTLAGLYFLIKWLQDPALLNKILNWYFAIFGIFSVSRLITDVLDIGHSLIYPKRYAFKGMLYLVHSKEKKATPVSSGAKNSDVILSPLPGFLSCVPLPLAIRDFLWADRAMPKNKWTIRIYLHRLIAAKMMIGMHGLAGFIIALTAVMYFNFADKPWYLTNLMGFGFSYSALQLMSPTTFATGSLILGALFFYDIYFVFFTPMMVTVAKSLDIPIKLMFPRPSAPGADPTKLSHAMLGLGDVVLPGIMIGLALRFDLYLFYLRKQTRSTLTLDVGGDPQNTVTKAKYFSLSGRWSEHFWTHTWTGRPLFSTSTSATQPHFTFPKTYFNASLIGYILGMLTTLAVMQIAGHAQPALLYLVPGVVGALWITAFFRGELNEMWNFSEAVNDDEDPEKPEAIKESVRDQRRPSFFSNESMQRQADKMEKAFNRHVKSDESLSQEDDHNADNGSSANGSTSDSVKAGEKAETKVKRVNSRNANRELFSFSIEAPWTLSQPQSIAELERLDPDKLANRTNIEVKSSVLRLTSSDDEAVGKNGVGNWKTLEQQKTGGEPAGKRLRTS